MEEEVLAEHFGIPYSSNNHITFLDYVEKYLKAKKHKKRWERDKQSLLRIAECLGDPPLSRIGKSHMEKLEAFLFSRNLKATTVNRYFEVLRHFFNLAIEDGYVSENPVRFYVPFVEDGERRPLTADEIRRILEAAKSIQENSRTQLQSIIYDIIVLALNTGMRLSEILNLKKSYIRDDIVFYPISETKHKRRARSQRKKVKVICLNSRAMGIIGRQRSEDDFVFPLKWRDPNVVRKAVVRIREMSGVSDFIFHRLRHTVSTLVSSKVSLATAKTILGHSDLKTTMRYTHSEVEEQRRGVTKIEEYFDLLLPK